MTILALIFLDAPTLLTFLQSQSVSLVLLLTFVVCVCCTLMACLWGEAGLMVYTSVAVVAANIQVLKAVPVTLGAEPVALGTIVFGSTFLVSDILTEYCGKKAAQKNIMLSMGATLFFTVLMMLGAGASISGLRVPDHNMFLDVHAAMVTLFTPAPALVVASLMAYGISQWYDVWIFRTIARLTHQKYLWLRTLVSTLVSAFLDTVIFSVLAWRLLAVIPLPWDTIFYTYILGTYGFRVLISLSATPCIYLARYVMPGATLPAVCVIKK